MKIDSSFMTHAGRRGPNEDAIMPTMIYGEECWSAIADGMGGSPGGDIAAQQVIEAIRMFTKHSPQKNMDQLFEAAHQKLKDAAIDKPSLAGMGTTLSTLLIKDGQGLVGHVGDSRIYHLRKDKLMPRTKDQTEVQHLIDEGILSEARAKRYPRRNILLSSLSPTRTYNLYTNYFDIKARDRIILMTDGVYNVLSLTEIRDLSMISPSSNDLCSLIEQKIAERGPEDDYSAIVVSIVEL